MKIRQFIGGAWGQRVAILVIICAVMAVFERQFFTAANAASVLFTISVYGTMACGMLFVVLLGGLDLSVGSMAGVAACIVARLVQDSGYTAEGVIGGMLVAFAVCVAVGVVQGMCVTYLKMPSFVVTLSFKYILYGAAPLITGGSFIYYQGNAVAENPVQRFVYSIGSARPFGVPLPIIIFVFFVVAALVVVTKTTYGRRLYAIGGNDTASALVGIRVRRDTIVAYIASSFCAAVAGVVLSSINMQAGQTTGNNYEGSVLMAMIVGGINLAGGEGDVAGAVFGALFVGLITNMMTLLSISPDFQKFAQGAIILAAVCINAYSGRRAGRVKLATAPAGK
ncbi:MAG: ABC transporter permease [Oscillospiraceae bacterium]|jgi:ribose/xylose/arabinose/galactoside ABC-type transport system permease subunit|nr:ABC transporter permease [Oscillospiraceae bacterium]